MRLRFVAEYTDSRQANARAQTREDYHVDEAGEGTEALERLADGGLDAVVLDVSMPVLDGLEVSRRLRAAGDRTPILMLTARDDIDDRVAGLSAGAVVYVVKHIALRD